MSKQEKEKELLDAPEVFINRELSWLSFARRVLALVENPDLPLLERVKFAGIVGMLHDEFFMKRVSGLKRRIEKGATKPSIDGLNPIDEFEACRRVLAKQAKALATVMNEELRPALREAGLPLLDYDELNDGQKKALRVYFEETILPTLIPLAVDSEHPFPFVSNLGLNLAVTLPKAKGLEEHFVRLKVPSNHPRWVELPDRPGFTPLEQVIGANLDLMFPANGSREAHLFRVTRGAQGDVGPNGALRDDLSGEPGSILRQVGNELKARRFAGVVRLQVTSTMPGKLCKWLTGQLGVGSIDVDVTDSLIGLSDLAKIEAPDRADLNFPAHEPVVHPRLEHLTPDDPCAIFEEMKRGDILLHHPYHCFESSVLRFIQSAADDPAVLAIKLTIYRTSSDSSIVRALAAAARKGKQVAVLIEVTARFDEAPNIAWGKYLENEGAHVAYGVERLKTHVKLALVVRQEERRVRQYAHVGTGNYHPGTAKIYEDVGVLTTDAEICSEVAGVFNSLTGAMPHDDHAELLVAPDSMRRRFIELIRREARHAREGRPSGITAKMNQLQDVEIIRALYRAGAAGVPIRLIVRGLCCIRPGVEGLSENIRVISVVGRFLEHSRIFRFTNGGDPEYFIGSADWMKRNLNRRVETVMRVKNGALKRELEEILDAYDEDNSSAWDGQPDGSYVRRSPAKGEPTRAVQEILIERAKRASEEPRGHAGVAAQTDPAGASFH